MPADHTAQSAAMPPKSHPETSGKTTSTARFLLICFLLSMLSPYTFNVADLLLTAPRVILAVLFPFLMASYLTGGLGRPRLAEVFLLLYITQLALSIITIHGFGRVQFIGISAIELITPYLLGRYCMRRPEMVSLLARVLFFCILVLLPLAILESVLGIRIVETVLGRFGNVTPWIDNVPRLGLNRAQTVFEHPILYGVFAASVFAILCVPGQPGAQKPTLNWKALVSALALFLSLSTGAYLVAILQALLMGWNKLLSGIKKRWRLLVGLMIFAYVAIDILSNRTPFEVFISYMTLNPSTGYWRLLIFEYGMDNVMANPIFGIGLNDWVRPPWMQSSSVDNLWLLLAMRNGIPAFVLFLALYVLCVSVAVRKKLQDPYAGQCRNAIVFSVVGIAIGALTVYFWGKMFLFFLFLLGACVAIGEWQEPTGTDPDAGADPNPKRKLAYTRFATTHATINRDRAAGRPAARKRTPSRTR